MRRDTVNTWGSTQDERASQALASAMATAVERLEARCRESGAHGVIGTELITEVEPRYVAINLVGTAIRPVHSPKVPERAFTSNLSAREFVLLGEAGWNPVGLVSGCRFVRAYRRKPTQAVSQKIQNVELANPTKALARARAETMVLLEERACEFRGSRSRTAFPHIRTSCIRHPRHLVRRLGNCGHPDDHRPGLSSAENGGSAQRPRNCGPSSLTGWEPRPRGAGLTETASTFIGEVAGGIAPPRSSDRPVSCRGDWTRNDAVGSPNSYVLEASRCGALSALVRENVDHRVARCLTFVARRPSSQPREGGQPAPTEPDWAEMLSPQT